MDPAKTAAAAEIQTEVFASRTHDQWTMQLQSMEGQRSPVQNRSNPTACSRRG
jgi:hypothetical protein